MNCPAKMYVYEHVRFPEYEVSTSMYLHITVDNPCSMRGLVIKKWGNLIGTDA